MEAQRIETPRAIVLILCVCVRVLPNANLHLNLHFLILKFNDQNDRQTDKLFLLGHSI